MKLPPRLPVHPPPLPHETLSSWLTRLARANASSLASWLPRMAPEYPNKAISSLDFAGDTEFLIRVACAAAVDGGSATLVGMTFRDIFKPAHRHCYDRWLLAVRSAAKTPPHRFCPVCVADDPVPHLRRAWRLGWVRWCPTHAVRMEDGCRACGAKLAPWRQRWDLPYTGCWKCGRDIARSDKPRRRRAAPTVAHGPSLVMDAMREALPVVLSRVIGEGPNDDLLSRVWCAQKFAARVDGATWVEWGGALGYNRGELTEAVDEDDAEAWTFALGWHLAVRREDLLFELADRYQGAFNRATTLHCPRRWGPFRRPVRVFRPVSEPEVRRVVREMLDQGAPIHFAAVAARLQVPPDRLADAREFRAVVEDAARVAREHRREELRAHLESARDDLRRRGVRVSRVNLAAALEISMERLAAFEREIGDSFAVSPCEEYPAMVVWAVETLQARGERVSSVAVARLLGRERSLIEKHPELKRIIRDAQRPVPTPAEVRRACQELRAKGERVSIVAVARMLGVGRHVIERSSTLGAAVRGI